MKLAFSTLGCPDWTFGEIFSTAKDLNFDGVEIRGIGNEVYAPSAKAFHPENISVTKKYISDKNIPVSLLATGIRMGDPTLYEDSISEARDYFKLAEALDVKYLRVMITGNPYPEDCDYDFAVKTYKQICDEAKVYGIIPLVETNGILADSAKMKKFIEDTDCDNAGVLWDVHHPYRFFGETVDYTLANIAQYIKYVHVKDSIKAGNSSVYKMMGYGDVPVKEAVFKLKKIGYDSYVTLEWVKRWCPDLEDGGIVFSHFVNYMSTVLAEKQ